MAEQTKETINERFLDVLTGREELDVVGQFLDEEQQFILEDAQILRNIIISLNEKDLQLADKIDLSDSKNKLIERLKKEGLI